VIKNYKSENSNNLKKKREILDLSGFTKPGNVDKILALFQLKLPSLIAKWKL
jgi:hypothetical protein